MSKENYNEPEHTLSERTSKKALLLAQIKYFISSEKALLSAQTKYLISLYLLVAESDKFYRSEIFEQLQPILQEYIDIYGALPILCSIHGVALLFNYLLIDAGFDVCSVLFLSPSPSSSLPTNEASTEE